MNFRRVDLFLPSNASEDYNKLGRVIKIAALVTGLSHKLLATFRENTTTNNRNNVPSF